MDKSMRTTIEAARRGHQHSCRVMPQLWPLWHAWQCAERDLIAARKARDDAKHAWRKFAGQKVVP